MAHLVPSDITTVALAGGHSGELRTLQRLRAELPPEYWVFHGVHWTREYRGATVYGEIDFVIVNRAGEILVIEQKNGPLVEADGQLFKGYEAGLKNTGGQILRSLNSIREKFEWLHGRPGLHADYLLYCPDHRVLNVNAAALHPSRIIDAGSDGELIARIQEVLPRGANEDLRWTQKVLKFFQQSFDVVPDIHAHVSAQERGFTRQAGGLATMLGRLEMRPFRLRVRGTAGCGKSLMARAFFDREIEAGRRPLLLCFNRPLAERLKAIVGKGGFVSTWYGLCYEFLKERGQSITFPSSATDAAFWKSVQERVVAEPIPDTWRFDSLVVDEGQDFEPEWMELISLFLRDDGRLLWLEDPDQNIRGTQPVPLDPFVTFRAEENFRSPFSIARFLQKFLGATFVAANDLPGMGVGVSVYATPNDQVAIVAGLVQKLVTRGFGLDQIVVVSVRGTTTMAFAGMSQLGKIPVRRFTGGYDLFGNQLLTDGKLLVESVYRFKGQQAPAVILVDIDETAMQHDRLRRLLFVGGTRATVRLELVMRDGPFAQQALAVANR